MFIGRVVVVFSSIHTCPVPHLKQEDSVSSSCVMDSFRGRLARVVATLFSHTLLFAGINMKSILIFMSVSSASSI
jgi:hypothetical protein